MLIQPEPQKDWLKKAIIFIFSVIVHIILLILLIQAMIPVTIINFPVSVTQAVIVPPEKFTLPSGFETAQGALRAGKGALAGESVSQEIPSLESRLVLLEKEASLPSAGPRPPGPMPYPPFNLVPSKGTRVSSFTLKLPVPTEKEREATAKERPRPGSPHDYWRYILATEPGKEKKPAELGSVISGPINSSLTQTPRVAIEGPGYDLSPWAQEVVTRLQKNWQIAASRIPLEKGILRLLIGVDRTGEVSFMRIIASSQRASFDRAAVEAVNLSLPLPQLPPGLPSDFIELMIIFECDETRE